MDTFLPLRDDLRGRSAYGAPQLDVPVRLNTNENPYGPSPALAADLAAAVALAASELNRYPDRDATALRADLAAYLGHNLTPNQIWAANGSNEVLQQLLMAFGGAGRKAMGFEPSYSMHRLISLATQTDWVEGYRENDFNLDPERVVADVSTAQPDVVFLTSPNNPTGTALDLSVIEAVYEAATGIVVVDEAYAEFARDGVPSALTLLPGRPRLVVTRTMSKAFSMAGLRLGYLAADPELVDCLLLVRLPYHLSELTQAAARVALKHAPDLLNTVGTLRAERDRLVAEITALGCRVVPSDANFVLFGGLGDQTVTWQGLLDRGVLIRDVGLTGWLRATAGTPEENDAFLAALADVLREQLLRESQT
ncbi:histidinol-phosphate transaminase [Sporichthya polymorpha]|uniref:histidinol-phosphate transaminase n=1 Tax=Sporichthya polymorpha TaxID=35751 RepID=UPI000367FE32|nr:histidinol-phosphate transaminase [Sporichthya polymorpha]